MNLRDFLNWYSGFSENVEEAPTPKQWGRITAKIAELQASAASGASEPVQMTSAVPSEPVGGVAVTAKWRADVKHILMDNDVLSLDPETAEDEMRKVSIGMNELNTEPSEYALAIVSRLTN